MGEKRLSTQKVGLITFLPHEVDIFPKMAGNEIMSANGSTIYGATSRALMVGTLIGVPGTS